MDIEEKIDQISKKLLNNPNDIALKSELITVMNKILYDAAKKELNSRRGESDDFTDIAAVNNIEEVMSNAKVEFLTKDLLSKGLKKYQDKLNIKAYTIKIYIITAKRYKEEYFRGLMRRGEMPSVRDDDGNIKEIEIVDDNTPEDGYINKQTRRNKARLIASFISTVLESDEKPHHLLAVVYLIILPQMYKVKKTIRSIKWATEIMNDKTIEALSDDSSIRLKKQAQPYKWGAAYNASLEAEYETKLHEIVKLKAVIYTREFSEKDMKNWTSPERVLKRLRIEWIRNLIKNNEIDAMYELSDISGARKMLNGIGDEGR